MSKKGSGIVKRIFRNKTKPEKQTDTSKITAETPEKDENSAPTLKKRENAFRLQHNLKRSSNTIIARLSSIFTRHTIDDNLLQDLEDMLIEADLGIKTATSITQNLKNSSYGKDMQATEMARILAIEIERILIPIAKPLNISRTHKPHIIFVVGVNGSGKTTTIGKLAAQFRDEGKKIMLVAGDTFRAAAIDQLKIWAQRTDSTIVTQDRGSDAAGLVFDAIVQARKEGHDIVLIDTAGRLQNRQDLMNELDKIIRVMKKQDPSAPHDTLLVLDATTGQNALGQVEAFKRLAGITGIIMTKLDGTARGGILVSIAVRYGLPVHAIGIGEETDDLQTFKARDFAQAITGIKSNEDK